MNLPKLDLNITNRCNFRCRHCAFDSGIVDMIEPSLEDLEKILKETKKLGGKRIDITGGEPLVRPDVEQIIVLGKSLGYKIELVTNALLLTDDLFKKFKAAGLDAIAISLDGSNPEIYNRLRNRDDETFYRVLENIKKSVSYGFSTKVNTVAHVSNLEDIPNITEWCIKNKISEHGIYYFTPVGRGNRTGIESIEPLKWLDFIRTKLTRFAGCGMRISLEIPLIEKKLWQKSFGCVVNTTRSHLQILPDGYVYPCAILAYYKKAIANLKNNSITEIWHNEQMWYKSRKGAKFDGSCVSFNNYKIKDYKNYKFVCPLKKFELEELL